MIEITTDNENDLTTFKYSGTPTGQEILETLRAFYQGSPTLNILSDMSDAIMKKTHPDDMRQTLSIAQRYSSSRLGGKTAIVAQQSYEYGIFCMLQTMADIRNLPFEIKTFRTLEEARQWLLSSR